MTAARVDALGGDEAVEDRVDLGLVAGVVERGLGEREPVADVVEDEGGEPLVVGVHPLLGRDGGVS